MNKAHRLLSLAPAALLVFGATLSTGAHALATWSSSGCNSTRLNNGTTNGTNVSAGTSTSGGAMVGNGCALNSALDGTLTVSAWSNTQGGTVETRAYLTAQGVPTNTNTGIANPNFNTSTNGKFETAQLMGYDGSGFGIKNRGVDGRDTNEGSSPEHAVDNNGFTDGLLLSFSESTTLRSLTVGWSQTDADLSVLAYTGAGAPVMTGKSVSDLLSSGWSLVSNLTDVSGTIGFNAGALGVAKSSSYWFVSAYNQGFGGGYTNSNDHFKLSAFSGERTPSNDQQVSEPGALALAGVALLGLWGARRRRSV
jgi:hypothetical protein